MKKLATILVVIIVIISTAEAENGRKYRKIKVNEAERFHISYDIQSLDIKASKNLIHHFDGEVFFLSNKNKINFALSLNGHFSNARIDFDSEGMKYGSFGPTLRYAGEKLQIKIKTGYFFQEKEISYNETVIENSEINGFYLGANFNLLQNDFKFAPQIELFAEAKIQLKRKYFEFNSEDATESIITTSLTNYHFGVNVHLYRIDVAGYYMSPIIGFEKSESFTRKNIFQIKIGASMNNGLTISNILQVGMSFSFFKNNYYQTIEGESTISPCMFGFYLSVNPSGLFAHKIK
jgi:hypothetical protein